MKKLLAITLGALLAVGCDPLLPKPTETNPNQKTETADSLQAVICGKVSTFLAMTEYYKITIDGHEYITARGIECVSIIHSESCPCKISK